MEDAQRRKADKKFQERLDDAGVSSSVAQREYRAHVTFSCACARLDACTVSLPAAPMHAGRKMYKDVSSAMDHFPSSSMSPDAAPSVYHERADAPRHVHDEARASSLDVAHPPATRRASGSALHANMSAVEMQKVIADGMRAVGVSAFALT